MSSIAIYAFPTDSFDSERKLKHLNKQKEGKARLKRFGNVDIPTQAFYQVLDNGAGSSKGKSK